MPHSLKICLGVSLPLFLNAHNWAEEVPAASSFNSVMADVVSMPNVKVKPGKTMETLSTVRTTSQSAQAAITEEELTELVKQLDDDRFEMREEAVKQLLEVGEPAVEQVAAVAAGESLEVSMRAFRILDNWMDDDEKLRVVASKSLTKLAENGENEAVSSRAKRLLAKQRNAPNFHPSTTMPARPSRPVALEPSHPAALHLPLPVF